MRARMLGLTLAAIFLVPGYAAASVLYVGDSLGVGTSPYLRDGLGGVGLEVDAEIGRRSATGVEVLRSRIAPEHEVVVFDLGTNDDPAAPEALASDLAEARAIAGDRCLVTATLNRPPLDGVTVDGLNEAVVDFARQDPATVLVDWHAQAERDPGLLSDGVHPVPTGYALRASMFADAISSCLAGSGAAPPGQGGFGREGRHTQPLPTAEPQRLPRRRSPADPVEAVAAELARAVAVGAEFG